MLMPCLSSGEDYFLSCVLFAVYKLLDFILNCLMQQGSLTVSALFVLLSVDVHKRVHVL